MCVGGAFIVAVGLCSLFGVPYGPVHTSLPFMLMGLGVDDIFVMMASWDQVLDYEPNRSKPLTERVAMMLSHAGAAITVTSFTDVVAFIIGASTVRLLFYVIRKLSTLLSKNTVIIRNLFYSDIELISAAFLLENNAYLKKKKNGSASYLTYCPSLAITFRFFYGKRQISRRKNSLSLDIEPENAENERKRDCAREIRPPRD